ncbi:DEAD/DEAH box helicase [Candidatus Kaiserbacteria bacterium]|nr:DEAD/DEAH box helicase [Candidatus Kaiserbacteria bacterium]
MTRNYRQSGHSAHGARHFSRGRRQGGYSRTHTPRRNASHGDHINHARFVNKAVITEEVEVFTPEHRFTDFHINESIKTNIANKGYITPTPIQDRAIPHVLRGEDIVGVANTGTGKTGAFLIPLIDKVLRDKSECVLIMVPTRELAQQIEEEFWGFASHLRIGAVSCVGGANINRQIATLRRDPHFVIGTPGRLKDLVARRAINLSRFRTVVLDEADRMLDMGFIADMKYLLALIPEVRHTLFFSATLSREIESLIGTFLKNPTRISVKTSDTAESVEQDIVRTSGKNKIDVLHDLLIQPEFKKVLIFGRTKHGVEKLSKLLVARGFKASSIHGNKSQSQRERALAQFKRDHITILVATDVAARGIDVEGISHVINYEIPTTFDDYVHRIGRTGRAGKRGMALTFVE